MADDLEMRAKVKDEASAPLRNIQRSLQNISKSANLSQPVQELRSLHAISAKVGNEMRTVTTPALSGLGIAGGGLIATFIGISNSMRTFSGKLLDLSFASKELGLSTAAIKGFSNAAEKLRIAPDEAIAGLQSFKKNAEDFQLRIGGLRDELRRLGAGDVVDAIARAKDPMDQLRIGLERMQELQKTNPAVARRFAEAMYGSAKFARMGWSEIKEAM